MSYNVQSVNSLDASGLVDFSQAHDGFEAGGVAWAWRASAVAVAYLGAYSVRCQERELVESVCGGIRIRGSGYGYCDGRDGLLSWAGVYCV